MTRALTLVAPPMRQSRAGAIFLAASLASRLENLECSLKARHRTWALREQKKNIRRADIKHSRKAEKMAKFAATYLVG